MPERIVLAIDGGVASAAALEWTISRAANTDLNVRLMTIDESAVPVTESSQRLEAVRALGHAAGRFGELAPRSKIEMVLLRGKAVDVLARESVAADLVVIGSHGSSVLSGVFSATVPLQLAPAGARHSPTDINAYERSSWIPYSPFCTWSRPFSSLVRWRFCR